MGMGYALNPPMDTHNHAVDTIIALVLPRHFQDFLDVKGRDFRARPCRQYWPNVHK